MKIATLPTGTSGSASGRSTAPSSSDPQGTFAATLGGKIADSTAGVRAHWDKSSADSSKKKVDASHKRDEVSSALVVDQGSTVVVSQPPLPQMEASSNGSWSSEGGSAATKPVAEAVSNSGRPDLTEGAAADASVSGAGTKQENVPGTTVAQGNTVDAVKTLELVPQVLSGIPAKTPFMQVQPIGGSHSVAPVVQSDASKTVLPSKPADVILSSGPQSVSIPFQSEGSSEATIRDAGKVSSDKAALPVELQAPDAVRTAEHQQAQSQAAIDLVAMGTQPSPANVAAQTENSLPGNVTANPVQTVRFSSSTGDTNSLSNTGDSSPSLTRDGIWGGPALSSRPAATSGPIQGGRVIKGKSFASDARSAKEDALIDSSEAASNLKTTAASSHVTWGPAAGETPQDVLPGGIHSSAAQLAVNSGDAPLIDTPPAALPQNAAAPSTASSSPQHAAIHQAESASAMSNAQLIQSAHGSEMRLGIKSAEFGDISINTSLSHQTLSAQISMEHTALGHALMAHLPAIEEKLSNAYGVQAKVELRSNSQSSASNDSGGEPKQGRPSTDYALTSAASQAAGVIRAHKSLPYTSSAATTARLDIRI